MTIARRPHSLGRTLATGAGVFLVALVVSTTYVSIFAWKLWDRVAPNRR